MGRRRFLPRPAQRVRGEVNALQDNATYRNKAEKEPGQHPKEIILKEKNVPVLMGKFCNFENEGLQSPLIFLYILS